MKFSVYECRSGADNPRKNGSGNLYGCLPAIKSNLHCFVIKSAANLYSALRVEFFSFPDCSTGPDAYPLANTSSSLRAIDALVVAQV